MAVVSGYDLLAPHLFFDLEMIRRVVGAARPNFRVVWFRSCSLLSGFIWALPLFTDMRRD